MSAERKPKWAQKRADGSVVYFWPNVSGGNEGQSLTYDESIAEYQKQRAVADQKRCADPRCNRPLKAERSDKQYCNANCNQRHKKRIEYRLNNNLSIDETPVNAPAEQAKIDLTEERHYLDMLKADAERNPVQTFERDADGKLLTAKASAAQRAFKEARQRQYTQIPILEMYDQLPARGFMYTDFWPEQLLELFELWKKHDKQLPTDATIMYLCDQDVRNARIAEEQRKRDELEEAQRRGAQLYPDMDRVRNDGSVAPQ